MNPPEVLGTEAEALAAGSIWQYLADAVQVYHADASYSFFTFKLSPVSSEICSVELSTFNVHFQDLSLLVQELQDVAKSAHDAQSPDTTLFDPKACWF